MPTGNPNPWAIDTPALVTAITGESEEARELELIRIHEEARRRASHTLSRKTLVGEIVEWARDARLDGWDGNGAARASQHSIRAARRLAELLPQWIPDPSVAVDREGEIELFWVTDDRQASIAMVITDNGDARASCVSPTDRFFGTWRLEDGHIPNALSSSFQRLISMGLTAASHS
jgi:hypothetical protein